MQLKLTLPTEFKQCTKCKESVPLSDFPKNRGSKDGLFSWCKRCASKQASDRYWSDHISNKARSSEHSRRFRRRVAGIENAFIPTTVYTESPISYKIAKQRSRKIAAKHLIRSLKQVVGCQLCPERAGPCLDFHHINQTDKSFNFSDVHKNGTSLARLVEEMSSCCVLCANCHRKVHAKIITIDGIQPITRGQIEQAIKALDNQLPRAGN